MIWTIKISLVYGMYAEEDWEATLEIDSASTLADLHYAIQDAVEFDDDHLYEFYIAKKGRARNRVRYNDENDGLDMTLENLFPLGKGMNLFYMFDYGDSWLFKISKTRKNEQEPIPDVEYPRVVDEKGKKPEQYPDWDDEDEEDEDDE